MRRALRQGRRGRAVVLTWVGVEECRDFSLGARLYGMLRTDCARMFSTVLYLEGHSGHKRPNSSRVFWIAIALPICGQGFPLTHMRLRLLIDHKELEAEPS